MQVICQVCRLLPGTMGSQILLKTINFEFRNRLAGALSESVMSATIQRFIFPILANDSIMQSTLWTYCLPGNMHSTKQAFITLPALIVKCFRQSAILSYVSHVSQTWVGTSHMSWHWLLQWYQICGSWMSQLLRKSLGGMEVFSRIHIFASPSSVNKAPD
jgi:hypothetical protein